MEKSVNIILNNQTLLINNKYFIKILSSDVIRIGELEAINYNSYAAQDFFEEVNITVSDNQILFNNKKIIIRDDYKFEIYQDDKLLSKDIDNTFINTVEKNELLELEGHKVSDNDTYSFIIGKELKPNDVILGLGDKPGFLNKNSYEYINWNTDDPSAHNELYPALYKSIPFFIVHNELDYGIFLDNTYKTIFNFGQNQPNKLFIGSTDGLLNYYFFFGSMKEIIKNYTKLTGRYPLPQRQVLGYHQCRWSYKNKDEVYDVVNNFKKHNIPLDIIHLDIDYMDNYKVFTTSNERFPNMKEIIQDLKNQGIKIITIIDPGTKAEEGYFVYDEGIKNNYFATKDNKVYHNAVWPGDSVFPQFTSSKVRQWWGDLTKHLTDLGVIGIWNDMNEPASFKGPLPLDVEFDNDGKKMYHKEVHNIYGHLMAEATYNGLLKNTNLRPFVITRACYAGSQKYSSGWTGDNQSLWSHIQMAIPQQCNLGLSGMPFIGTDIGGFGGHTTQELITRWIQVGIFSPLCRNHSAAGTKNQEPYRFDETTIDIYRKFVNLRYKLIPYIYDLFYNHQTTGLPIIRPLVLEYPNDPNTFNLNDEFMLGESILVSPVVEQGKTKKLVYLPEGKWICYNTSKIYEGNNYYIVDAPIDTLPMFVKYNSIIPTYTSTNIENPNEIVFECYGEKGSYIHYQDNGLDFNYQNGQYNLYEVTFDNINMLYNGYTLYDKISNKIIKGE